MPFLGTLLLPLQRDERQNTFRGKIEAADSRDWKMQLNPCR